jgi:hypothetical protein
MIVLTISSRKQIAEQKELMKLDEAFRSWKDFGCKGTVEDHYQTLIVIENDGELSFQVKK